MNQSGFNGMSAKGLGNVAKKSPAKMRNIVLMGGFLHIAESSRKDTGNSS